MDTVFNRISKEQRELKKIEILNVLNKYLKPHNSLCIFKEFNPFSVQKDVNYLLPELSGYTC